MYAARTACTELSIAMKAFDGARATVNYKFPYLGTLALRL